MGGLSKISNIAGGLMLPGFPGTSTDPAKLFSGGGGGDGGSGGSYPAASFAPSQTGQLTAYQPNYETFYNPLAMLQAGQPSFNDPAWYTSMLGPAQQQNMMAAVPQQQQQQTQASSVNPWAPGGEHYMPESVAFSSGFAPELPSQLSQRQFGYSGTHLEPDVMRAILAGRARYRADHYG